MPDELIVNGEDAILPVLAESPDPQLAALASSRVASNIYDHLGELFMTLCEGNVRPWANPMGVMQRPRNVVTGHLYSGINTLICWMTAIERGYKSQGWVTREWLFKRAPPTCRLKVLPGFEGSGRTGQKTTTIVFMKDRVKAEVDADTGEERAQHYRVAKTFQVFNTDQIEGLPDAYAPAVPVITHEAPPSVLADKVRELVERHGINVVYADHGGCYYRPATHEVHMVPERGFAEIADPLERSLIWHAVHLHEFTHWTEHYLKRGFDYRTREGRAMEELVAEMGAAFLAAEYGAPHIVRHPSGSAGYIESWRQAVIGDRFALVKAAKLAMEAADYLIGRETKREG